MTTTATLTERRSLGGSDLRVATLCLGGNVFGWSADERASHEVLDAYRAAGGNFVDTANTYSAWAPGNRGGESETIIGRWMASRGCRDDIVLATKVGYQAMEGQPAGLGRQAVRGGLEASLRRLGTDRVDLYYLHRDDPATPLEETLEALDACVRAGQVRWSGLSNYSPARVRRVMELCRDNGWAAPVAMQPPYNLVDRAGFEGDLQRTCRDEGLGVAPYYSLARGFLTGKYRPGAALPASARAAAVANGYLTDRGFAVLAAADRVAAAHGATPAQVALAWLAAQPTVVAPIASATRAEQVRELAGAGALRLAEDELAALREAGESPV